MHHSFDISLASDLSVHEAIMIHHFQHWIRINREIGKNNHDGHWWSYQTQEWIAAHFPYWSEDQVQRIIKKLVKKEILLVSNHNKAKYDQTNWYAFKDEAKYLPAIEKTRNRVIDDAESRDSFREIAEPIPDSLTDTENKKTVCPEAPLSGSSVSKVVKMTSDRKEIIIRQDDIFRQAIAQRKDWTTAEIMQAWEALIETEGVVNCGFGFVEGTIKNMRVKNRFDKMSKKTNKAHEVRSWNTGVIQSVEDCEIPSEIDLTKLL